MAVDSKKELADEVRRALNKSFAAKEIESEGGAPPPRRAMGGHSFFAFLKRSDPRAVEAFTRELGILLGSGIDLLKGLKLLAGRAGNPDFKKVLSGVADMVEKGSTFWRALSNYPYSFPRMYVNSVKAGESSGRLEFALEEISSFYEFEISTRKKMKTAVTYPAVVLGLAAAVLIILSVTVFPVFSDMLVELNAEVPAVINFLDGFSGFVSFYRYALIMLAGFLFMLPFLLRSFPGGRILSDRIKLRLPVFGAIYLRITIARFSRSLASLLASGVSITEALDTCAETAGNSVVAEKLYSMKSGIEKGEGIEYVLRDPGVLPALLVDMFIVGEQSGELEKVLNRVADVYGRDAEDKIAVFATVLEPALILCMGILVAFVFAALFLPYINILAAMGG